MYIYIFLLILLGVFLPYDRLYDKIHNSENSKINLLYNSCVWYPCIYITN